MALQNQTPFRVMRTQLFNDFFLWEAPLASAVTDDVAGMILRRLDPTKPWGRPRRLNPDFQQLSEAVSADSGIWEGTYIYWVPVERLALSASANTFVLGVLFFRSVPPVPLSFSASVTVTLKQGRWAFVVCASENRLVSSGSALAAAALLYSEWVNDEDTQREMMESH